MKSKSLFILFLFVFTFSAGITYIFKNKSRELKDNPYSHLGGDFQLTTSQGKLSLENFKGKAVIMYLGFTSCPDICPLSLNYLTHALDLLDVEDKKKIRPLFVSVDWKRDTPDSVAEYVSFFSDKIVGATGSQQQIDALVKAYGAFYQFTDLKDSALEYTVDHSSRFYLIDDLGRLRDTLTDKMPKDEFVQKIKYLLKEF